MKSNLLTLLLALALIACNNKEKQTTNDSATKDANLSAAEDIQVYGNTFSNSPVLTAAQMGEIYNSLKPGDTVPATFSAKVEKVCKAKGCWMQVDVGSTDLAMIKFKDYGFFVPTDIDGDEVVINGDAFISEVSVEEQRHYAEDEGRDSAYIAGITAPKKTLSFTATGVKSLAD